VRHTLKDFEIAGSRAGGLSLSLESPLGTCTSWDSHVHYRQRMATPLAWGVPLHCDKSHLTTPTGIVRILLVVSVICHRRRRHHHHQVVVSELFVLKLDLLCSFPDIISRLSSLRMFCWHSTSGSVFVAINWSIKINGEYKSPLPASL
jgi:hypothetical protein